MEKGCKGVELDVASVRKDKNLDQELNKLHKYQRLTNYLAAAMIYLKDNILLKDKISIENVKPRLLGHWGTCPGLNLVYSHCNYLIKKHDLDMFIVIGPGHGAPAALANLWLEGSLGKYYPNYKLNTYDGVYNLIHGFSWPGGFPSHVNSELPGCIHEGGELGYALAVSFGAVMDNPHLIVTCVVGDGECESGPTATAWHGYKYIDPKYSGAVIPIIHLNGFKISSRTIYGSMSDQDLINLFTGYGYQVRIVQDMRDIDADMSVSLEWALSEIRKIQQAARNGEPIFQARWPLIIMKTPKGWTGVKEYHGKKIEGTFRSHQVPIDPRADDEAFNKWSQWLTSYNHQELISYDGIVSEEVLSVFPKKARRMGLNHHTRPEWHPLDLPDIAEFGHKDQTFAKNGLMSEITEHVGQYFARVIKMNPHRFRVFSPDELESNKLEGILTETVRCFQWDKDMANKGGQLTEVLSEHQCQGWMQGYVLTGRFALFPSYETFLGIITTMAIQYAKFIKIAREVKWRPDVASLNYIATSTLWRQEHNGYSHQDPMFINNILNMKKAETRIYLPPDTNTFLCYTEKCLNSKNALNLLIGSKKEMPSFLTMEEARRHSAAGASVWKDYCTYGGENPDVVIVGCGNETNIEAVAACILLRKDCPSMRIRFVNVSDLLVLNVNVDLDGHGLSQENFNSLFTPDKPVIFNFHGYPSAVQQLLFGRTGPERYHIFGYIEEGTTTTPFKMLSVNKVSRYHIAMEALAKAAGNSKAALDATLLTAAYSHRLAQLDDYILKHGKDPEYLSADLRKFEEHLDKRTFESM
jgi:xylulose-5-phosphate/fructose-6-phosphate phosphoketolase